ncbi:thioesterase II family protein [Kitasatospora purpeofusca]|uniref:Alpha/beta fold hydrolase n=1 Tax=Kitasatospora purpeofusca TaxID=67352 RepID=A0ABZ1U651_9ACTN|nr:alpha/beta fold hydrolase [Kitasatospora purpeofusca]
MTRGTTALPAPPSLHRVPRGGARQAPLVCLPFAGGGSRSYDDWQGLLPRSVDPVTVRLPGRESRLIEPLPTDLRGLAVGLAREIGPVLTGTFAVFGHSMGALLAFEFVRELRRSQGVQPACLFVSGMRAPDRAKDVRKYGHLTDDELRTEIEQMGGTDPAVLRDPDLWELVRPIIKSDLAICDEYAYQAEEPLSCPVVAYGSTEDDELDQDLLETWRGHTTGDFAARMFEGDHFYFQKRPDPLAMDLVDRLYRHVLD